MAGLLDALRGKRVFIEFPDEGVDDWQGACEVLVQERLGAWSFGVRHLDRIGEARERFGRRAIVGVHGVRSGDEAWRATQAGAQFVTSPIFHRHLVEAAGEVPLGLGALTPNEVAWALEHGAPTVCLNPADQLGLSLWSRYLQMFPEVDFVPVGRLTPLDVELALGAGVAAVGLSATSIFSDTGSIDADLVALRRRAQSYADRIGPRA